MNNDFRTWAFIYTLGLILEFEIVYMGLGLEGYGWKIMVEYWALDGRTWILAFPWTHPMKDIQSII